VCVRVYIYVRAPGLCVVLFTAPSGGRREKLINTSPPSDAARNQNGLTGTSALYYARNHQPMPDVLL